MASSKRRPDRVEAIALLSGLPAPWPDVTLRAQISRRLAAENRVVVALDDDPTGTQTVHDVTVLARWEAEDLVAALQSGDPAFYVLTNTRSMGLDSAQQLNRDLATGLVAAATATRKRLTVVSRSDSTLRGHFPGEVDALEEALSAGLGHRFDGTCIVPFFPEGGRFTVGNVHWVQEGAMLVPAAETPYAQDSVFGYSNSDLRYWVEEKTQGRVRAGEVVTLPIDTLRREGPEGAANVLLAAPRPSIIVVNAADYRDLEVFVCGLQTAEEQGRRYLFRTAAAFVKVAAGIAARGILAPQKILSGRSRGAGLTIVGSHVPKSSAQAARLRVLSNVAALELSVPSVIDDCRRDATIVEVARAVEGAIARGRDTLLYTSRKTVRGPNREADLAIARSVSSAVVEVVSRLCSEPRYVIAKGGITASDVATKGLDVRAARVLGQILPGVPVWRLGPRSRWPGLPYVVFPGNVGDDDALADVVRTLGVQ